MKRQCHPERSRTRRSEGSRMWWILDLDESVGSALRTAASRSALKCHPERSCTQRSEGSLTRLTFRSQPIDSPGVRSMHRTLLLASLLALPAASALPLHANQETQPASQPASQPATTQPLQARITGVEGLVQVRDDESAPWQRAVVGMIVGEGAEFRTGPRSAVRFQLPPDQTITLDRLGTVKLVEAIASARGIKTDLGMRYGRVRYDIEAAGVSHDATIHSPGSTLAVRGTQVSLTNTAPFPPVATSLTGKARYTSSKGRTTSVGGNQKSTIENGDASAAQTAIENTYVDPTLPGARSEGEQQAIISQPLISTFTGTTSMQPGSIRSRTPAQQPVQQTQGNLIFQLV